MEKTTTIDIHTQRLRWEQLSLKYVEAIFKEFTDAVTKYLRASTPKVIQEEEDRIKSTYEKHEQGKELHLVVTDEKGDFIGCCGLTNLDTNTPELGLWLKESARGKGYGKEMIGALIERAETHKKFEYLVYRACVENIGTRKIAEHFGGILERDENGKEKIFTERKFDKSSSFPAVEYRIYKK